MAQKLCRAAFSHTCLLLHTRSPLLRFASTQFTCYHQDWKWLVSPDVQILLVVQLLFGSQTTNTTCTSTCICSWWLLPGGVYSSVIVARCHRWRLISVPTCFPSPPQSPFLSLSCPQEAVCPNTDMWEAWRDTSKPCWLTLVYKGLISSILYRYSSQYVTMLPVSRVSWNLKKPDGSLLKLYDIVYWQKSRIIIM